MRRVLSLILAIGLILNFSFISGSHDLGFVAEAEGVTSLIPAPVDLNSRKDFSIGVNIHRSSYEAYPEIYLEQQIHAAARMGSKWIRFGGYIPDDGDWSYLDTAVGLCNKYGMKIIMNIYPNLDISSEYITLYCETMARRYNGKEGRGKVDIFQVLNEVDIPLMKAKYGNSSNSGADENHYYTSNVDGKPDLPEYLGYFKAAEKGIHSKDSTSKFMVNFSSTHYGMITYFLKNGLKLDMVGWDLYTNRPYDREASAAEMTAVYDEVEEKVYKEYKVPFILAETNVHMAELKKEERLNYKLENYQTLIDNLYLAFNRPWVKGAVLYELLDEPSKGVGETEASFGLIANTSAGGTAILDVANEKPIYKEIQRLIGGNRNLAMIKRSTVNLKPYEKLVVDTADDSGIGNDKDNTSSSTVVIPEIDWDTQTDGSVADTNTDNNTQTDTEVEKEVEEVIVENVVNPVRDLKLKETAYEIPWVLLVITTVGILLLAGGGIAVFIIINKKKANKSLEK